MASNYYLGPLPNKNNNMLFFMLLLLLLLQVTVSLRPRGHAKALMLLGVPNGRQLLQLQPRMLTTTANYNATTTTATIVAYELAPRETMHVDYHYTKITRDVAPILRRGSFAANFGSSLFD